MPAPVASLANGWFDAVVRPRVRTSRGSWNAYLYWQGIGFALGASAMLAVAAVRGNPLFVVVWLVLLSIAVAALLYKGAERLAVQHPFLIWVRKGVYHYQIATLAAAALFLGMIDEPRLPFLDVLVIGLMVAQICGRVGCLMVGCCHGRPAPWGVRYGVEHQGAGYRSYLPGVRLFPVQLTEAAWLLGIAAIATRAILGPDYRPGEILAWYAVAYGAGRFVFELLRADTGRLYLWGFTEAQWTALLAMGGIAWAERASVLPAHPWHAGAAAGLAAWMLGIALRRRFFGASRHLLLHPYHLREVVGVVNWISELAEDQRRTNGGLGAVYSAETTLGVQISLDIRPDGSGSTFEYSLSSDEPPRAVPLGALARFIAQCRHPAASYETASAGGGALRIRISPGTSRVQPRARPVTLRSGSR